MTDKAGLAANQDYGKDELSAEKLLTRHSALQTAVDTYSPIIQGLAEQARRLVQSSHFAASKISSRQVKCSRMTLRVSVYSGAVTLYRVVSSRSKTYLWVPLNTDSTNVLTSILPLNSDHLMVHSRAYNCFVCTYSHAISCV